jgi:hypothetical protein
MINNTPLRLTTLHFAQRFRMEGPTFMIALLLTSVVQPKVELYLLCSLPSSSGDVFADWLRDSQDERVAFGDGYGVFVVRRQ